MIMKKIDELTTEELWKEFPVYMVDANPEWSNWYWEEKENIGEIFQNKKYKIAHIGSTAVPNLKAKPIIDILIEVDDSEDMNFMAYQLVQNGYKKMHVEKNRISLNKGYTEKAMEEKVFHVHMRKFGDNDEIYFRNYLRRYPSVARNYEKLKMKLAEEFKNDREAYTMGKSEFIQKYTEKEKQKF